MYFLVINEWSQLLLLTTGVVLCLAMSIWFGAHHFRTRKQIPILAAQANVLNLPNLQPPAPVLHVATVVQHGRIVEIQGSTEPGTVVMINGQPAIAIFPGNTFKHFLGPLPAGTNIVSVTCQNEQGGVNTQQIAVTLE